MQLIYAVALGTVMASAMGTLSMQLAHDRPQEVAQAAAQVDQYRMFVYVASRYMNGYSGGAATIPWSTLRTARDAPSGARNLELTADWKVVAASDNSWVACSPLDERGIAMLQQFATAGSVSMVPTTVSGRSFVVVGVAGDVSKAAACS